MEPSGGCDDLPTEPPSVLDPAAYHLTRHDFYSPIPVIGELPMTLWERPSEMLGVDLRVESALALLTGPLLPYLSEFRPPLEPTAPGGVWLRNGYYESPDADTLYAMLRYLKPGRGFRSWKSSLEGAMTRSFLTFLGSFCVPPMCRAGTPEICTRRLSSWAAKPGPGFAQPDDVCRHQGVAARRPAPGRRQDVDGRVCGDARAIPGS